MRRPGRVNSRGESSHCGTTTCTEPGCHKTLPYSGVAALFRSALARGDPPRVFEDGQQMRDFVEVEDVARANVLAIEAVESHPN